MPENVDIAGTLQNPDFLGLPPEEKQKFLTKYVPEFGQLGADEQQKFLTKYAGGRAATPAPAPGPLGEVPPPPTQAMQHVAGDFNLQGDTRSTFQKIKDFAGEFTAPGKRSAEALDSALFSNQKDVMGRPLAPKSQTGFADTPIISISEDVQRQAEKNPAYGKQGLTVLSGLQGAGMASADVVSGLSTPKNLALIGAIALAPPVGYALLLKRLAAAGFSAQMAKGAADEIVAGYQAYRSGDQLNATRHFSSGVVNTALAALTGTEAGKPGAKAELNAGMGAPPEGYNVPAPKQPKPVTKFTLAMEGRLADLGFSKDQMDRMTPQQAADAITKGAAAQPHDFPAPPVPPVPKPPVAAAPTPEPPPAPAIPEGDGGATRQVAADRLKQVAREAGYDVPTYLQKIREKKAAQQTTPEEDGHLQTGQESAPLQNTPPPANTLMADKLKAALQPMKEREQLQAHMESVANENYYVDAADMLRSLREKQITGRPLTDSEREILSQGDRLKTLPSFDVKQQPTGALGNPPPPPSRAGTQAELNTNGAEATSKQPTSPTSQGEANSRPTLTIQRPTAKATEGPYSPEQVSWFTSLFNGKKQKSILDFDVDAGHYGNTDEAIRQMQDAGLVEEAGRDVVGKGKNKQVHPTYRLTDEGRKLRGSWASQRFPGEVPEGSKNAVQEPEAAPVLQREPQSTPEAGSERGRVESEQPGIETPGEGAEAQAPEQAPVESTPLEKLKSAGFDVTPLVNGEPSSPLMIERKDLKGRGYQVTVKPDALPSPEDAHAAIESKKNEVEAARNTYHAGQEIPSVKGKETIVDTPNGTHKAQYRVVEADDLKPSHNPNAGFTRNDAYPIENERQYHTNKNAQAETENYAREGKWHLYVNGDPTASNGPSQSLPDGTVMGGNGRTMGLQLAYGRVGSGEGYKQYLIDHASEYGIDPEAVKGMQKPVLDRVLTEPPTDKPGLESLGKDLNKGFAKKMSNVEAAVSAGRRLSIASADKIGAALSDMGDDASLRKLFTDDPKMVRDLLLNDGIVSEQELPEHFNHDGTLNDKGKDFVENMLLGSVVRDADLLNSMPAELRNKLERSLPSLVELGNRVDSWNITHDVRDAVKQYVAAKANGVNVKDWVRQSSLDAPPIPERVATIAEAMTKKPSQVSDIFKRYASEARQDLPGQDNMFGVPDPHEAFDRVFGGEGQGGAGAATAFRNQQNGAKKAPGSFDFEKAESLVPEASKFRFDRTMHDFEKFVQEREGMSPEDFHIPPEYQYAFMRGSMTKNGALKYMGVKDAAPAVDESNAMPSSASTAGPLGSPPQPPGFKSIPAEPMRGALGEFHHETLMPGAKEALQNVKDSATLIRDTFAPGGEIQPGNISSSDVGKMIVRKRAAERADTIDMANTSLEHVRDFFSRFNREQRAFNTSMVDAGRARELGEVLGSPEVEDFVNTMRTTREAIWKKALAVKGVEGSNLMRPDYWLAHYYETLDGKPLSQFFEGHKPLEGSKSSWKGRSFPTMAEAIEWMEKNYGVGVRPKFENPVDFEMAKISEISKFIEGRQIVQDLQANNLAKFVHALSGDVPDGYRIPTDSAFTVYAPPHFTVSEAFDDLLMKRINDLAQSLGVSHTRKPNIGGENRWGFSVQGASNIVTKSGGPERVITHELGHAIDDRYGLADKWVGDPFVKKELRDLADARYEGRTPSESFSKYVRKGPEKIANAIDAYVHNRDYMKQVAPVTYGYIESLINDHPELRPLRDIRPSQVLGTAEYKVPSNTVQIMGHYALPNEVATVIDRHLSTGLSGNPIFENYRRFSNALNSVQLGMSAFHLVFTANDMAASKFSLGLRYLAKGDFPTGLKNIAQGNIVTAPMLGWIKGSKYLKARYGDMPLTADDMQHANDLIEAGGRTKMDSFYRNSAVQSFWDAWRGGNKIGAALKSPAAMVEGMSSFVMNEWVPRMKLAAFFDMADFERQHLPENASEFERRAVLSRAWDAVDDRLGQLVYDNLFWSRTLKDLGMASVRSLGWQMGDIRQAAGAAVDFGRGVSGMVRGKGAPELTPRLAQMLALPVVIGMQGAALQYMLTGSGPDELKDYFFPKTGRLNPDGSPARVSMPSYMKDYYAYGSGFRMGAEAGVRQAATTLSHKVNPGISTIYEMLNNQDFYGNEIRNSGDSAVQQWADVIKYVGSQFVPFSVRNAQQSLQGSSKKGVDAVLSPETFGSLLGITQAPRDLDRTDAELMARKMVADQLPRGARTNSEFEKTKLRNEVLQELHSNFPQGIETVKQAMEAGTLSQRDISTIRTRYKSSWLQAMTKRLALPKALRVYEVGSPEEQDALKPVIQHKIITAFRTLPPEQQDAMTERLRKAGFNVPTRQLPGQLGAPPAPPRFDTQAPQ